MRRFIPLLLLGFASGGTLDAGEDWTELLRPGLKAFREPHSGWEEVADVVLDAKNPRRFVGKPGQGAWWNGDKGRARNLFTREKYGDLEITLEFNLSKNSNSGIKFHGHYEIQFRDSYGKKLLTGEDCGGIYPRAIVDRGYKHIDKGIAPKVNACKAPGEWQTLRAVFTAPRFDRTGKKVADARVHAVLNGQVVQDTALKTPTGDRWKNAEMAAGPLMLQADHGPVAFRALKVRTMAAGRESPK